ncbi:hypothetical protein F4804DRAFT_344964 [Jackrogersella minutella]|nr:hypothetical protein F4804DRAFT_344964 [Jackrogersella minutella]
MGPFALPVPGYRLGIHPRAGKRSKTDDGDEGADTESEWGIPSRLPSDSINPLSHTPDTIRQFAVAGLSASEEVPSKVHPLFPHKSLPSEGKRRELCGGSRVSTAASGAESENDGGVARRPDKETTVRQLSERLRHLSTMTAIMHRCLGDGDIARAKRAFGLLVQTKDVDIRLGGLWAVGSEILMRDGEEQQQIDDGNAMDARGQPRRWGSAANIETVRSYFESLIQQYPHDQHRAHLTSALDFWPALFGIEIYSLDAESRRAAQRAEDGHDAGEDGSYAEDASADPDGARRSRRDEERRHRARDELRRETRGAAEQIARRMDQTMENAPYASHRELLRLRANLALFIGDLRLPSRLLDLLDGENNLPMKSTEEALRSRAEEAGEHGALARRREEHEAARAMFRKILDGRGEVDGWVLKFLRADEDEEDRDVSHEDGW